MPPPAAADADALLAAEQAAEASALWVGGDFDAAHQTLQRLEATVPTDARVQLNLWVAGYYADAGSSLETLGKELAGWLKANPAAPTVVGQYNTHALAAVNYSLILFLQQQHATALSVLEPLFEEVDILQDGTALCLCALLLEIYLDCCQLPKAVEVLQYLQNQAAAAKPVIPIGSDGLAAAGDAGSSSSNQGSPSALGGRDSGSSSRSPAKQEGQQAVGSAGGGEGQLGGQQQDGGGQEGPVVPLSQALPVLSKTKGQRMQEVLQLVRQQGGKPSGQDLDPLLHLYKARLALACKNHKAAKKEVRSLLSCEPDSPAAVLLKAELETCRQQPRKALKTLGPLLTTAHQHTIRCRLQLLNLLAAIHSQLDKHHLAALYLSTALDLHAEAQEQQQPKPPPSKPDPQQQRKQQGKRQQQKKQQQQGAAAAAGEPAQPGPAPAPPAAPGAGVPRKSHWLLQDMSDALSYNMGLQQLALQDWQGAMESFEAASSKFFTQPQLWLRWAEACLGMYHQQLQQQQLASLQVAAGAGPSTAVGGKGKAGGKQGKGQAGKKQQQQQQQGSSPEQLLQQAAAHLSTGLVLLQEQQAAAAKQLEAATAAAASATAAGEPPPDLAIGQSWRLIDPPASAAAGAGPSGTATAAESSSSQALAGTAAGTSSAAAAAASAAGTSGSAVGSAAVATAGSASAGTSSMAFGGSSMPADAALLAPELAAVRQALLSNKAYVALQLGQPQEALEAAQELVACSRMSPQQHYLGTSYAAEALCLLGRVEEAKLQLQAHIGLFMQHSSSGGSGGGLLAGPGDAHPGSSSSAPAAHHPAGAVPAAAAAAPSLSDAAVAGSTKSFDGSCISCSKGVCGNAGHAGVSGAGSGPSIMDQAALLHNLGAVLVLQGQHEEGHRHAAIAAALKHAVLHGTQQDAENVLCAYAAGQGLSGPHMG